ncbi:MAG: glycosyltransferase [Lachnospiraceae bacterium]|nr:glycosyltransferase [Lachnospiraceae bacterium]
MIPVSVCIIAKNEEKNIEKCLSAIRKYSFEIVVADTGSTDRTKEIASRYADKVIDFKWVDDFSAARNFSIKHASHDWILVIDCDEFVDKLNVSEMQKLMKQYPYAIGQLTRDNICYDQNHNTIHTYDLVERLFHRNYYHYEGTIHEQVVRKDGGQGYGFEFPLYVTHTGYHGTPEEIRAKSERNLRLLEKELEKHPDDPFLYYHLGESYCLNNEYEKAYECFDKGLYLDVDENLEYVQRMVVSYGYVLLNTNRLEKAQTLENLYEYFKNIADYLFLLGDIYLKVRRNEDALKAYFAATTCEKHFDEGTNSYRAFHNIACIYEAYGHREEAKKYFQKAGNYPPAVERLQKLLHSQGE